MEQMSDIGYVMNDGTLCPFCKSKDITAGDGEDLDGTTYYVDVDCRQCGKEWQDRYHLTGYYHDDSE